MYGLAVEHDQRELKEGRSSGEGRAPSSTINYALHMTNGLSGLASGLLQHSMET